MFEEAYYFQDKVRFSPIFGQPNYDALFFAALIPLLWSVIAIRGRSFRTGFTRGIFYVCELILWYLLTLTVSRGALIAVLLPGGARVGLECSLIGLRLIKGTDRSLVIREAAWMLVWIVGVSSVLLTSDYAKRASPSYMASDESATNRIDYTVGGLRMATQCVYGGVGEGASGWLYTSWYDLEYSDRVIRTLINSYLTIGVEYGLVVLHVFLALCLFPVAVGLRLLWVRRHESLGFFARGLVFGCVLSIGVVLLGNLFSTMFQVWGLNILPGICSLYIISATCRECSWTVLRWGGVFAVVASGALVAVILCLGYYFEKSSPEEIDLNDSYVKVESKGSGEHVAFILSDIGILDTYYGRVIRRFAGLMGTVYADRVSWSEKAKIAMYEEYDVVIAFGRAYERLQDSAVASCPVAVVFPMEKLEIVDELNISLVVLESFDRSMGVYDDWIAWAENNGVEVCYVDKRIDKKNLDWVEGVVECIANCPLFGISQVDVTTDGPVLCH